MSQLLNLQSEAMLPEELEEEIRRLKKERNAVILAHYYQDSEIQDLADYVGDSLALAKVAQQVESDVIVFCGVHFMAETAKILNPTRTVVVPDLAAGCSLADGCRPDDFKAFIDEHPDAVVVSYINTSAAVKALSDVICTSSNAVEIVKHYEGRPVIFAPDRHLARWVANQADRPDLIVWQGACIVHEQFNAKALAELRVRHPEAEVLSHPECEQAVLDQSDFIGSTKKIIDRAVESPAKTLIIGTEDGVFHQIPEARPGQGVDPGARDGRELRLQPLSLHAAQHPRETLRLSAGSEARTGARRGHAARCGRAPRKDARTLVARRFELRAATRRGRRR